MRKRKLFILFIFIAIIVWPSLATEMFVNPQKIELGTGKILVENLGLEYVGDIPDSFKEILPLGTGSTKIKVVLSDQAELKDKGTDAFLIKLAKEEGLITANSETGLYYALQTLKTMLEGEKELTAFTLVDWPDYKIRGVIEGFYGEPWSHEDRLSMLEFMGKVRMNTYVYAPKDDPYHRMQWKEPYPEDKRQKLQELVEAAQANQVNLVFAISPGNSVKYTSEEDWQALINKTEDMIAIGIKDFSLLFDDINPTLKFKDDRVYYKNSYGRAHIDWSNKYQEYLSQRLPGHHLVVVGTDYYQEGTSNYRKQFLEGLREDVWVFSTGYGVVAPRITKGHATAIAEAWGHEIVYWDNYPVNDYARHRLYMGPLSGRDPQLPQTVGFTFNPMNEAELSKVALLTAASYTWNSKAYIPLESWELAIRILGGDSWQQLRRFASNSKTGLPGGATTNYPEFWDLLARFNRTLDSLKDGLETSAELKELKADFNVALQDLKAELLALSLLEKDLTENLPLIYQDGEKYIKRLSNFGLAGVKFVEAIENSVFQDGSLAEQLLYDGRKALAGDSKLNSVEPSSTADLVRALNHLNKQAQELIK